MTAVPGPAAVLEVLYLDAQACGPCRAAIDAIDEAAEALSARLRREGRDLVVRRTHVTDVEQAAALGFVSSPTVRIDGVDIELDLDEQHCGSCSSLARTPVACRTFSWRGERYTSPPAEMILERVLEHLSGALPDPARPSPRGTSVERFLTARGGSRS